jgi:hypothetical protein
MAVMATLRFLSDSRAPRFASGAALSVVPELVLAIDDGECLPIVVTR